MQLINTETKCENVPVNTIFIQQKIIILDFDYNVIVTIRVFSIKQKNTILVFMFFLIIHTSLTNTSNIFPICGSIFTKNRVKTSYYVQVKYTDKKHLQ